MGIQEYLPLEGVQIGVQSKKKKEILQEIAQLALNNPALKGFQEKDVFKALWTREKLGSTGFDKGIAIPHCALEGTTTFALGAVIVPEGVDFDSLDGEPTRIIFYIIGPPDQRNHHIKLLSGISKALKEEAVRDSLLESETPADLRENILRLMDQDTQEADSQQFCQFTVHVQREEIFADLLELMASEVEGTISVIETNNAAYYLNRMPLFATYWNDADQRFNRIIIGVVKKSGMNNLIRRIHTDFDESAADSGLLITVQDLLYSSGHLDF